MTELGPAVLVTSVLRVVSVPALLLALLAAPPAVADDREKARLDRLLFARETLLPQPEFAEIAPLAAAVELITDGGFEVGSSPSGTYTFTEVSSAWTWQYSGSMGGPRPRYWSDPPSPAHSGNWCLYFDFGPAVNHLFQTVTIPAGASATLSFWLKVGTQETGTGIYDTLKVSVTDLSGVQSTASMTYSNKDAAAGYTYFKRSLDVSRFAGKTVRLQFDLNADSTNYTTFLLDDVSIVATSSTPQTNKYLLPSSAHATGANNAFYKTDLAIANRGTTDANYSLQFLGHDRDGTAAPKQERTLAKNKAVSYTDVLASVFGVNATDSQNYGAILITADSASLKIVSQTSTPVSSGAGTFGQSVSAQGTNDFVTPASSKSLIGLREDGSFRTNAVIANAGTVSTTVTLTLLSSEGATLGSTSRTLPPLGMTQVARVVTTLGAPYGTRDAVLVVSTTTAGAQVATYATMIDNNTQDPRTILP